MTDRTYNGWTNRATWLVNVWFSPKTRADVELVREIIEDAEYNLPDFMRDFLCTREINWDEIMNSCDDEEADCEASE